MEIFTKEQVADMKLQKKELEHLILTTAQDTKDFDRLILNEFRPSTSLLTDAEVAIELAAYKQLLKSKSSKYEEYSKKNLNIPTTKARIATLDARLASEYKADAKFNILLDSLKNLYVNEDIDMIQLHQAVIKECKFIKSMLKGNINGTDLKKALFNHLKKYNKL